MREIKWKFEGGRIQNGELFKFFVGWLFRQASPWTGVKTSTQPPQCHVLCWLSLSWIPHSLLPSPKKNPSQWVINSASFPTEVRLVAMINISPLAILACSDSCVFFMHLLQVLQTTPGSDVQGSTVSTSFLQTCAEMLEGGGRVVWARAVYLWPTEHTFHTHWSESTTFKQSREQPPAQAGFRSRDLVGILIYLLFLKYCSMLRTA